jgi:hypothetical protein
MNKIFCKVTVCLTQTYVVEVDDEQAKEQAIEVVQNEISHLSDAYIADTEIISNDKLAIEKLNAEEVIYRDEYV